MAYDTKYSENKCNGNFVEATCIECEQDTRHKIVYSFESNTSELIEEYGFEIDHGSSHQIIQCQGCMEVSFRKTVWNSDDCGHDNKEWVRLYPERNSLTRFKKKLHRLPEKLYDIYEETIDCFNGYNFVLAAVGLRTLLEGICIECGVVDGLTGKTKKNGVPIRKKDLMCKINGLYEKEYLTQGNATILHECRHLGNEAVHELARPSHKELVISIDIIENVIESVFEVPHKGEELKFIREGRIKK